MIIIISIYEIEDTMHFGPIKLPEPLQARCVSLINLGKMLNLFDINLFIRVMDVHRNMISDKLTIMDLQDIVRLCDVINTNDQINELLHIDINEFKDIINMFISVASCPDRSCGMWSSIQVEFEEEDD
jgi:hypothetical protein